MPHPKFLIAGALILGSVCYLMFSGINDSTVYYYTVTELKAKPELAGRGLRLSGHVTPGSIKRNDAQAQVDFLVYDMSNGETIPVVYQGIIPDTFKDNAEVVVEGTYDAFDEDETPFKATTLLAKCPSKYEGRSGEHPEDAGP